MSNLAVKKMKQETGKNGKVYWTYLIIRDGEPSGTIILETSDILAAQEVVEWNDATREYFYKQEMEYERARIAHDALHRKYLAGQKLY